MSNSISSSMHHVSILGATDYSSLVRLAKTASAKDRHASAELVDKLEKIVVVPDGQSPDGTVGIGSIVTFDVKGASRRTITLVDPVRIHRGLRTVVQRRRSLGHNFAALFLPTRISE
jgi:transcription elongation GreA/GreB family factor